MTKTVADRGYSPFVVIRPENEASQSLYKKLGFNKFYQMVRMTFIPDTWREVENGANSILKGNLENAVRQLSIEQRIIDTFQNDENGKDENSKQDEKCEGKQELDNLGNGDDYNHIKEQV